VETDTLPVGRRRSSLPHAQTPHCATTGCWSLLQESLL
jgi:hypothetical protein